MQLSELKTLPVQELISLGEECGLDNASRMKRQDVVFGILKNKAKQGEDIDGGGVLEILQDGFGFLRSTDSSYLAGPDDIYVSPSQIRRFGLRTGDTIQGKIRPPKEGERYFAILKIEEINFDEIAITSSFQLVDYKNKKDYFALEEIDDVAVTVEKTDGQKCERCWKYTDILQDKQICQRCDEAIKK